MHVRTLPSPTSALYAVFILPAIKQTPSRTLDAITKRSSAQLATAGQSPCANPPRTSLVRPFSTTPARPAKTRPAEKRTQLWDEEIPAARVQIISETSKALSPPQTRWDVLRSMDRATHRLVCLVPLPANKDAAGGDEWIPVCRIMSRKAQYEADKAKKVRSKEAKRGSAGDGVKTLELNWAIDANDLTHRLKRVREFLDEGRKVEIVLAKKKGGRVATVDECEGVLRRIRETVEGVEGAGMGKKMQGALGGVATLFLEGAAGK